MFKKIIVMSTLSLFIAGGAVASPLFNILKQKSNQTPHLMSKNKIAVQSEVDFSGNWKGQCHDKNQQFPLSLEIAHMGSIVSISSDLEGEKSTDEIIIGSFKNESQSSDVINSLDHSFAYWDRSNTKLILEEVEMAKSPSPDSMILSWTVVSRSTIELKNNHLNMNTTTSIFEDGKQFPPEKMTCTFSIDEDKQ